MTRRTWTPRRKLAVFETFEGRCHLCGLKIDGTREPWQLEHLIPLAMGGADDETNVAPAHVDCHARKTTKDRAQIAKANRVRAKHNGAIAAPKATLPGSRGSKWKRKVSGAVVRRDEDEILGEWL